MSENMNKNNEKGFTLIELLVAIVIAAIVMTSVYSVYSAQQRSYIVQEGVASMHQNLRAAMYFLEREVRMAGCDPTSLAGAGIQADSNASLIHFTEDFRGKDPGDPPDGDTGDPDEDITYFLTDADGDGNADDLVRDTGGVEANIEKVIAENIASLDFDYLDSSGAETAVFDDVRFVRITLVATSDDGSQTDTLQTRIHARNLGM